MNIGLYFGTFNPIHIGHLILANHFVENTNLDQVWMVVTPHNPLKKKDSLLDDYLRLHLVALATEDYIKIKPSDIEFKLPQPNYTVNTLVTIQEKYPNYTFSLIMGEDNILSIKKWKNYKVILENYKIFVYPRLTETSNNLNLDVFSNIEKVNAPIVQISSTFIRENIFKNKNVQPLLPFKVWEYIDNNNLYKTAFKEK